MEALRIKHVLKGVSESDSELADPGCGHDRKASLVQDLRLNSTAAQSFPTTISFLSFALWAELCSPRRYVEVLTLSTSERDLMWK